MSPSSLRQPLPGYHWVAPQPDEGICQRLAGALRLTPLASRILYGRGIRSVEEADRYLAASLQHMRTPFLFGGMERAVERLLQAIERKERILIYGDYDVDGLTSTAILVHFLRHAGLNPLYHVPDRLREGYGFHRECVPAFFEKGVQLIVTVDCGITAFDAVKAANECGIDVVITDHHECSDRLPPALAVLNPKVRGDPFPFRDLAGVGVTFYLVVALRGRMRERGMWGTISEPNLRTYLDLVALGTLADMVPLREENRIFVKYGLEEIASAKRPGVSILKEEAGLKGPIKDTWPLLYKVIPRINAPGRLGCASESLDLLLCEEREDAGRMAAKLAHRNNERRAIETEVYREARELAVEQLRQQDRRVIALASEGWHRGILGIVASRLARDFRKTVVLLSLEGDLGRGSVRTIGDLAFLDALLACRHLLEEVGGHQTAAGITLKRESLADFQDAFEREVSSKVGRAGQDSPPLVLDAWLESPDALTYRTMCEIEQMAPFGSGNPEPVIGMRQMRILTRRVVGGDHLKLTLGRDGRSFDAIGFQLAWAGGLVEDHRCWDVVFSPRNETWDGRDRMSLRILDLQPS
jgi:single-stranded-DNA-specific exonuclease